VNNLCDFEDMPILSSYTRDQAVSDGLLVDVLQWNSRPVMATSHIRDEFGLSELLGIWHEFQAWKEKIEPTLKEEDKLFSATKNNRKVWVIEDDEAFTIMYPEDY
jgi:hypothetical protein